jgi:ferrous iron transport protein B
LASLFSLLAKKGQILLTSLHAPWWIIGSLIDGLFFGVGAVISVMLPPVVIFFILFALMEDFGFIPRVAFNLDKVMQKLGSQGKQCLTCMMSYGCNIVGVTSSRIISNEKDRLVSILTSSLIICNGRFGPGIALAILLFGRYALPVMFSLVLLSLVAYFAVTLILNKTVFRHQSAGFMLELPPYRRPQFSKVIWRTLVDRVSHVMVRALAIAAPAALLIWIMGNVPPGQPFENTVIGVLVHSFEPLGQIWGLDGEMIASLLFTLPAKEIVIPSLAMTYGLQSSLMESEQIFTFLSGYWSSLSAYTFLIFYMLYLPCLVTIWAIWKETKNLKWTILSLIISLFAAIIFASLIFVVGTVLGF